MRVAVMRGVAGAPGGLAPAPSVTSGSMSTIPAIPAGLAALLLQQLPLPPPPQQPGHGGAMENDLMRLVQLMQNTISAAPAPGAGGV